MTPHLCVVGDALLDVDWDGDVRRVCRDAPAPVIDAPVEHARPGGAALAALLAADAGARVTLVTALAGDEDGARLRRLLDVGRLTIVDLGLDAPTPVKLRLRSGGQSIARVDRGCEPVVPPGPWTAEATAAMAGADAVLVSDYGRGLAGRAPVAAPAPGAGRRPPLVWDPHSLGPRPPATATLVTPNMGEGLDLLGDATPAGPAGLGTVPGLVALAEALTGALGCPVALTAGDRGAVLAEGGRLPVVVPTRPARGDACGAGDAFAVHAALALAAGCDRRTAVEVAVAAARAFVTGRSAGPGSGAPVAPRDRDPDGTVVPLPLVDEGSTSAAVRQAGGIVVAAGGCFDVLHAGHVQLLEHARRLGDHLVVLVNDDDSVRRLKGAGRPLNPVADRVAVLRSLASVDEVVVFGDDTPSSALRSLRPHLFVKGADYAGSDIEEREVVARWGGQVVLVPLVDGRSTTGLIATAAAAGA